MRQSREPSNIVRYSHLGIQFALVILLGIWAGAQLDKRFSTTWFTLVGTFVGAGIGFYFLYRETRGGAGGSSSSNPAPPGSDLDDPRDRRGDGHPPRRGDGGD